jgi:hypothetical protein
MLTNVRLCIISPDESATGNLVMAFSEAAIARPQSPVSRSIHVARGSFSGQEQLPRPFRNILADGGIVLLGREQMSDPDRGFGIYKARAV